MRRCQEKGTTATAILTRFIELYLDGSLDNLDAYLGNSLDSRLEERIRACVDEYLEKRLPSYLDNYLATNHATKKTRSKANSTNSTSERDFWFVQERAKYLGVRLNADQLLRVEMFAAEAYKERHSQPPMKKPYKNSYASVYPKADVDIIDSLIRGVAAKG